MKLHLPKKLTAALLAAVAATSAHAITSSTTTYADGTVFNGDIWTWNNYSDGTSVSAANSKFTNYSTGQQYAGNASLAAIGGPDAFWKVVQFNSETEYVGNTLRFAGNPGNIRLNTDYNAWVWIGGIITEAGNSGTFTLGRDSSDFRLKGNHDVNLMIGSNFTLKSGSDRSTEIMTGGTWDVASGKTLTFTGKSLTFYAGQAVDITGGGTVVFDTPFTGQVGSRFSVGEDATLTFNQAATIGGTIANSGNVNFRGAVTLSDSLSGFDAAGSYVDYNGDTAANGYAGALEYTIVSGTGNVEGLSTVTWNGTTKQVVDGKVTIGGAVDYSTYHLLTPGAELDLAAELQHNSLLTTVSLSAGNATITNGTIGGNLILANGVSYTWTDNTLQLTGGVTLGENAKFDLNGKSITTATLTAGGAVICNGTIDENLLLEGGASYTWGSNNLDINGTVILGEKVKLDLNGGSIASATLGANNATITNGTVGGSLGLADGVAYTWTDTTLKLTGGVTLGENSRLDLNGNTINAATLTAAGAGIENGTVGGSFTLADNAAFTWSSNSLHIKGAVTLRNNAKLDLGGHTLDQPVRLEGSATIGNGTIAGTLTVDCGKTLTLNGDPKAPLTLNRLDVLSGGITVTGAAEAKVSIGSLKALEETTIRLVHTNATTAGDTVYNGNLVIGEGSTVTAGSNDGWGGAYHDLTILKGGKLDLDDHFWKFTMYNNITLAGGEIAGRGNDKDGAVKFTNIDNVVEVTEDSVLSARVCVFGNENSVEFNVHEGKELAFTGDIVSIGGMTPDDKAVIFKTGEGTMVMSGSNASANSTIIVQAGTLKVSGDANPLGTGTVTMAGGRLDLGGTQAALDKFMFEVESAVVDNGTLTVAEGPAVTLGANLSGTGSNVSLGDNAVLDLAGNTLSMNVSVAGDASIGGGTQNGAISVAAGKTLTLGGNLNGTGAVTLDNDSTLDFGGKILSKDIVVAGEATVKNGVINNAITIPGTSMATIGREGGKLWLGDGVTIRENATFTMGDGAKLDLLKKTVRLSQVKLEENATANVYTGWLYVGEGESVTLNPNLIGSYELKLQGGTLDLGAGTLARKAIVTGNATMGNGTIGVDGSVIVNGGAQAHFSAGTHIRGGAVTAGKTAILALNTDKEGLLQELSVSEGHILGTGRAASLADGLYIKSEADLMIESMTLTANNEIHVGDNTITLKDVTIKISDDVCTLVNGIYTIDLKSLINCNLEMENVLLDATDLTLSEGFDPAATSVVFDFGDDVTIMQATGLDMCLGNYWSQTMSIDPQGQVIFTKLEDIPEPTTGTLGLLALAALAARRRK